MTLEDKDGSEGYPGSLQITLRYYVSECEISWEILAELTGGSQSTIVNMTNHTYFNLKGVKSDVTIDDNQIYVAADRYDVVDGDCLVTGEEVALDKSGLAKLRENLTEFSEIFKSFGDVDHNMFLAGKDATKLTLYNDSEISLAARAKSPATGITLELYTNQPCLQLYTGNFLTTSMKSRGKSCTHHGGYCLETQMPPNAINREKYAKSTVLNHGEKFRNVTQFKFLVEK